MNCECLTVQIKMEFGKCRSFQLLGLILFFVVVNHVNGDFNLNLGRILNGEQAPENVPHASRVTGFSMEFSTEGGGTFVSQRHVVTAARIVYNMMVCTVYFGNESMAVASWQNGPGFAHPDYDPVTFENDIGVVILGNAISEGMDQSLSLFINCPNIQFFYFNTQNA